MFDSDEGFERTTDLKFFSSHETTFVENAELYGTYLDCTTSLSTVAKWRNVALGATTFQMLTEFCAFEHHLGTERRYKL